MLKLPFTCMGCVNFTLIILLSPFASQLKPAALTIVTGEVPVITKSLPFGATEAQRILFLKTNSTSSGAHLMTFVILSIGVGNCGKIVTAIVSPSSTPLLQLSTMVFPSAPVRMVIS